MHRTIFFGLFLQCGLITCSQFVVSVRQDPTETCETDCDIRFGVDLADVWSPRGACQQGCRFFSLASLMRKFGSKLADTMSTCQDSCLEAFMNEPSRNACIEACGVMTEITGKHCQKLNSDLGSMSPVKNFWDDVYAWIRSPFLNREIPAELEKGPWDIRDDILHGISPQEVNLLVVDFETNESDATLPEIELPVEVIQDEAQEGSEWQWQTTVIVKTSLYSCLSKRFGVPQYLIGALLFIIATALFHSCIMICTPSVWKSGKDEDKRTETEQVDYQSLPPPSYYSVVKVPVENDVQELNSQDVEVLLKNGFTEKGYIPVHRS